MTFNLIWKIFVKIKTNFVVILYKKNQKASNEDLIQN